MSHDTHDIHVNSLAAWHAGERCGYFGDREVEVLQALHNARRPLTDREIQEACGYQELAKVQPRISTLYEKGVLVEAGNVVCPHSGRRVRTSLIGPPPGYHQATFL